MEAKITIIQAGIVWTATIEAIGDMVSMYFRVYTKRSAEMIDCVVIDSYWPSVSDWEDDIWRYMNQIIEAKDAIVESRIILQANGSTETERRIRQILLQILKFTELHGTDGHS